MTQDQFFERHTEPVIECASAQAAGSMIFEAAIKPIFTGNVFKGADPQTFTFLDAAARTALKSANWFPDAPKPRPNGRR